MKSQATYIIAFALSTYAASAEMTITVPERDCPDYICGTGRTVYIEGSIEPLDYLKLQAAIEDGTIPPYSFLSFHSTEGSVDAGVKLGRLIRERGLYTGIGRQSEKSEGNPETWAACSEACALAILGGKFRFAEPSAQYVPYSFEVRSGGHSKNSNDAQQNASVTVYLKEMGLEHSKYEELSTLSDRAPVEQSRLYDALVLTEDALKPSWSSGKFNDADQDLNFYVEGQRDTVYGSNKIAFFCTPTLGELGMLVQFDPQGRADEVLDMIAVSLELNGEYIEYDEYLISKRETDEGDISALFAIPGDIWFDLTNADTTGLAFQHGYLSAVFLGFAGFPLGEARDMLQDLGDSCQLP